MQKLLLILVLLFLPVMAFAGWYGDIEFGSMPEAQCLYGNIEVGYDGEPIQNIPLHVWCGMDVLMVPTDGVFYRPFNDTYNIGGQIGWKIFYIRAEHWCSHPVWSGEKLFEEKFRTYNETRLGAGIHFESK